MSALAIASFGVVVAFWIVLAGEFPAVGGVGLRTQVPTVEYREPAVSGDGTSVAQVACEEVCLRAGFRHIPNAALVAPAASGDATIVFPSATRALALAAGNRRRTARLGLSGIDLSTD